jgi:hypothetical protein
LFSAPSTRVPPCVELTVTVGFEATRYIGLAATAEPFVITVPLPDVPSTYVRVVVEVRPTFATHC